VKGLDVVLVDVSTCLAPRLALTILQRYPFQSSTVVTFVLSASSSIIRNLNLEGSTLSWRYRRNGLKVCRQTHEATTITIDAMCVARPGPRTPLHGQVDAPDVHLMNSCVYLNEHTDAVVSVCSEEGYARLYTSVAISTPLTAHSFCPSLSSIYDAARARHCHR
jgi:hypothetical protein